MAELANNTRQDYPGLTLGLTTSDGGWTTLIHGKKCIALMEIMATLHID
jgi:hypothetical protein